MSDATVAAAAATAESWVAYLDAARAERLYALRDDPRLQVAAATEPHRAGGWWVRGFEAPDEPQARRALLQRLPGAHLARLRGGLLYPEGKRLPSERLAPLHWRPIAEALPVDLPAVEPVTPTELAPVDLRLVPSDVVRVPVAQLVDVPLLAAFAKTCPAVRLEPLRVCFLDDAALVLGHPPLPLPGVRLWRAGRSLIPVGYAPQPAELLDVATRAIPGEYVAWLPDGRYVPIGDDFLQPLRRDNASPRPAA